MVRWEPGAGERLQVAALELYASKGFEQTTAAEIAAAVGLTERTFFRYFADKREVIFGNQELFQKAFVDGIDSAFDGQAPLDIVAAAVISASGFFPPDRLPYSQRRGEIIAANHELQERELLKMAALGTAMAGALRERGIPEPAATLAAESGVTVFRVAFAEWLGSDGGRSLGDIERTIFAELLALAGR